MSGAFCPWCGSGDCDRCEPAYEAPRHCRRCGRLLRVTVHPAGWEAECRRCRRTLISGGPSATTGEPG